MASDDDLISDLDLGGTPLAPRVRLHAEYTRDLTEADLAALAGNRGTRPKALLRIHSSHHALARCLATGMRQSQAALITGYTTTRIMQLEKDPAFQALVADYRMESKAVLADMVERMSNLSLDAIELLQERLHDAPQEFSIPTLLDVVKAFADRTGHGPGSEVTLRVDRDFVDRPPRETFEDWRARRARELAPSAEGDTGKLVEVLDLKKLN